MIASPRTTSTPASRPGLLDLLARRVVIFDGAMGTSIHALELPLSDYHGLENCNEILNDTRPDAIEQIHRGFLEVGCDVVETNTFGGMKHVLAEFGLAERCYELAVKAAQIARRAAEAYSTPAWPRYAAGSLGPGTKLVTLRQIDYDALLDSYLEAARGLLDGGVDALVIETCQDLLQCKTAIHAVRRAFEACGRRVPLIVSVTMETTGTMLVGTDLAAALAAIEVYPEVDVIGLNCATGPQEMSEHVRYLARCCTRPISVMPNAGLPQLVGGRAHFPLTPAELARWLKEFVEVDGVQIVGGCCGTTPAHLRAVVEALRPHVKSEARSQKSEVERAGVAGPASNFLLLNSDLQPGPRAPVREPACSSLYQAMPYRQETSFLIVGERCNTNGSRKFKQLLADGDIDGCVQMAVEQVKGEGAHVLDVCVDYVGRDGVPDMQKVIDRFAREVTAPLMLDSTQPEVIEAGLKLAGGKCIINSVNLEEGEGRLARIAALCRQYGAGVVALTIDEDPVEAMAKTADRKLAIASRLHDLLVDKHGLREEDIFFDCLTFPITTGNPADRRLALETLDGIERVMKKYPRCQSILGVSNVSFGLQPAARAVLNSAFLHEAIQRGLTAAIVHAGKILPRNKISDERWAAALDLIYDRRPVAQPPRAGRGTQPGAAVPHDPLERFIALFTEGEQVGQKVQIADLPVEERLKRRIIDGQRQGIEADLDEALRKYAPLEIINTFLLDGMKVVGDLFGSGQMQLPFVLKSAETMKAAVAHLEPKMERLAGVSRGKIVLATVRGDVHDIGKNLVDIILSNNGYTVYNLGIKQPINNIIAAWREHNADAIGLSGLLVKSTLVMRDDLGVLNEHEITTPVILGGAALTRRYVEEDLRAIYQGPLFYAKDAFDGLRLMQEIGEGRAPKTTPAVVQSSALPVARTAVVQSSALPDAQATVAQGSALPVAPEGEALGRPREAAAAAAIRTPSGSEGPVRANAQPVRARSTSEGSAPDAPAAPAEGGAPAIAVRSADKLEAEIEQRYGLKPIDDEDAVGAVADRDERMVGNAHPATGGRASRLSSHPISGIRYDHPAPTPPFWGERVLERIPLKAALGYINETMLFQVQWGFRKKGRSPQEWKRYVDAEIRPHYRALVERCEREGILQLAAVYGYWPCSSNGDDLIVYEPPSGGDQGSGIRDRVGPARPIPDPRSPTPDGGLREILRFTFPRQKKPPYWCLSDFWRPVVVQTSGLRTSGVYGSAGVSPSDAGAALVRGGTGVPPVYDVVAFHIVTAGRRVSEVAREWFAQNRYQQYLFLHGLGVETAEALAEYLHKQVRMELGIAGRDERELQRLFKQGYQGSRFSFGYPACPNLEDQAKLMQLLRPERIGITLSEEYQLDPEQSTSAMIAYHPQARYFNVR